MALEKYYLDNSINNGKEKKIVAITNRRTWQPYEAFKPHVLNGRGIVDGVFGRKYSEIGIYNLIKSRKFYIMFYPRDREKLRQILRDEILFRKKQKSQFTGFNSTSERVSSL